MELNTIDTGGEQKEKPRSLRSPSRYHLGLKPCVILLVSQWPLEELVVVDILGSDLARAALTGTSGSLLVEWLMEALLTMKPTSRLRKLDLSGFTITDMFQVPLLWLPPEERTVEVLSKEIHSKYSQFLTEEDTNIDTVLNWKVSQLADSKLRAHFQGQGRVEIRVDCQANLSEWISMCDEVLGLMVSARTPFQITVNKLSVQNYHHRQAQHLHWLLSMIDKESLKKLGLCGYRKSIALSLYEFHRDLRQLTNLGWFAWATCGPKLLRCPDEAPSQQEILLRSADVLHTWSHLTEALFNGVTLTDSLAFLLNALPNPLRVLYLCKTELSVRDVDYLSYSHHVDALSDLTLEKTNLHGMAPYLVDMVRKIAGLRFLCVKDTALEDEERIDLLLALQEAPALRTLVLYDTEAMASPDAYEVLVELAANIGTLQNFYVFPFNYEPFEKFHRESVYENCGKILAQKKRKDLCLGY